MLVCIRVYILTCFQIHNRPYFRQCQALFFIAEMHENRRRPLLTGSCNGDMFVSQNLSENNRSPIEHLAPTPLKESSIRFRTNQFTIHQVTELVDSSRTLPLSIFVGMIWGTGNAFFLPAAIAYALEYVSPADITTVSTFRAISDLGLALGPVIMGLVIPLTGYLILFLCLTFICFINLCYFQFYVRIRNKAVSTV
jgi:hypothetical protein